MKNMKIKSYTFKKNSGLNKETKDQNNQNTKVNSDNFTSLNNNVLTDVDKILKSPGLNIFLTKYDEKGIYNINKLLNRKQTD
jgi:hypothetical protein